jgi:hypothetical protein
MSDNVIPIKKGAIITGIVQIEVPDNEIGYIINDEGDFIGVGWKDDVCVEGVEIFRNGEIFVGDAETTIPHEKLKDLMLAWLTLEYPDLFDDE